MTKWLLKCMHLRKMCLFCTFQWFFRAILYSFKWTQNGKNRRYNSKKLMQTTVEYNKVRYPTINSSHNCYVTKCLTSFATFQNTFHTNFSYFITHFSRKQSSFALILAKKFYLMNWIKLTKKIFSIRKKIKICVMHCWFLLEKCSGLRIWKISKNRSIMRKYILSSIVA